ncbi:hypothetical protein OSB04_024791 [Centaurea solstitialis]|uniref:Retrovirus-related Pol polyprotein from transposon TNT 1-94 n=1 Tax=Centaurea solstitialis TaxID=347529 RepID=A0AA38SLU9_9ASTR|nr:hypothetical protein OSB04_024791 [Centaurea solstitialis]
MQVVSSTGKAYLVLVSFSEICCRIAYPYPPRIPIYCDSKSAIQITANPVQYSRTKHIDIRYHFIKDHVEKGNVELYFVESDYQLADLFAKPFDEKRHFFLLSKLGMLDLPA